MSTNKYPVFDYEFNSCLVGANTFRILSDEAEFQESLLEEISDPVRQTPGQCYVRVVEDADSAELWMVPFAMNEERMQRLQSVIEQAQIRYLGAHGFYFPFDLISEGGERAYLIRPIDRERYEPIRKYLPASHAPRWQFAMNIFRRVKELGEMGLTSNGISRDQLRVRTDEGQVYLWLNETLSTLEDSRIKGRTIRHEGFMALPTVTEQRCYERLMPLTGKHRDMYSAAVLAFYLIEYAHPFVGSAYYGLVREDYKTRYNNWPEYIMAPGGQNGLGNQLMGKVIGDQWSRTLPQLKELFDGMFTAVADPVNYWQEDASYWDPDRWLEALEADAAVNDNQNSRTDFHFINERYHQV